MQQLLFTVFKILENISARGASYLIDYQMRSPRKLKRRTKEIQKLESASRKTFSYQNFKVQEYRWGNPENPVALCIHGWEGNAGNFGAFSELLPKLGYQMIAIDGPAHGESSRAKVHMFEYIDFVTAQVKRLQPALIVSHSFGSVCTVFSMIRNKDLTLEKWVAITAPNAFRDYLDHMLEPFRVKSSTVNNLIQRIEKRIEFPLDELDMQHSQKYIHRFPKTAIFHSKTDKIIPFWQAQNAAKALNHADFFPLEDLGHYRILWDATVVNEVETWLQKS